MLNRKIDCLDSFMLPCSLEIHYYVLFFNSVFFSQLKATPIRFRSVECKESIIKYCFAVEQTIFVHLKNDCINSYKIVK